MCVSLYECVCVYVYVCIDIGATHEMVSRGLTHMNCKLLYITHISFVTIT